MAVEDSSNGMRSAAAAGMAVIAFPNPHYPPDDDALALAAARVGALPEITPELASAAPLTRSGVGVQRRGVDWPTSIRCPSGSRM